VQILVNVLDNAVKFTPEGGSVSITAAPEVQGSVVIKITDTASDLKEATSQTGSGSIASIKRGPGKWVAPGLGLSIVKHLMKAHEGSMEIESTLGHGTTVSLHFPVSLTVS